MAAEQKPREERIEETVYTGQMFRATFTEPDPIRYPATPTTTAVVRATPSTIRRWKQAVIAWEVVQAEIAEAVASEAARPWQSGGKPSGLLPGTLPSPPVAEQAGENRHYYVAGGRRGGCDVCGLGRHHPWHI